MKNKWLDFAASNTLLNNSSEQVYSLQLRKDKFYQWV